MTLNKYNIKQMYQQRQITSQNKQQIQQDKEIRIGRNFNKKVNQEINLVQQIYNIDQRNPRCFQLDQEDKGIQIKTFQTSTKSNLDQKSVSQQSKQNEHSLQKRLFEDEATSTKINLSSFVYSEQAYSPKSRNDIIQIKLFKPIDQKFLSFIREYGYILGDIDNKSSFTISTTERSRMPSNERPILYSNSPPPQKSFRTKLFNH